MINMSTDTEREYVNPWYRKPENRQIYSERARLRYQERKEELLEKRKTRIDCELCGGHYTPDHRQQHFRSKKHQKALDVAKSHINKLLSLITDAEKKVR